MKRSNRRAAMITATLAALMSATYGQITFAATDGEPTHEASLETTTGHDAAAPCKAQASNANSPLTVLIQPPAGGTMRLTYVPADGWKLDAADAAPKAAKGRVTPVGTSRREDNRGASQPTTVFIDGPTGYTYIWRQDLGWTFAGRVTDRIQ
ncbi:hypothetical protein SAMN02787142_1793 [Burkholderia sp. WP9]|uniref:hypothetical protein n=1 Tax=Burkholderia sp. WP9 TaxID=1500263 RepID=UPI000899EBA2|nr:hypothetical protein [Burkholderia sp. WP9]SEC68724.1 hypothetical protein SAMN02787142_1793 [Burkholderia sp. WP9]